MPKECGRALAIGVASRSLTPAHGRRTAGSVNSVGSVAPCGDRHCEMDTTHAGHCAAATVPLQDYEKRSGAGNLVVLRGSSQDRGIVRPYRADQTRHITVHALYSAVRSEGGNA